MKRLANHFHLLISTVPKAYPMQPFMDLLKPVFDSFENAVTDNQRLTSAQGSVGTTSGSGGERMLRRFPGGRAGGRLRRRGWPEKHRP